MDSISKSIKRKDHDAKINGYEKYVGDYFFTDEGKPILTAKLVRTSEAHAEILNISVPELPEGYYYVSAKDAPKNTAYYPINDAAAFVSEEEAKRLSCSIPVFADKVSEYAGQPVGMIVGPDGRTVRELVSKCKIEYRVLPAVIHLKDSTETVITFERGYGKYKTAFVAADFVYEETFETGRQYHAYLEAQGLIAEQKENGDVYIHGSMQCPFDVRDLVSHTLDCDVERVHVRADAVGGGFGGKQDFPCFLAQQAAVAAITVKKPLRLIPDRAEDLQFNSKRHPSETTVRAAVKDGKITALEVDGKLDTGAFFGSSGDVCLLYFMRFPGVYSFPNLHVTVRAMKTNTPPTGSMRGFGAPQCEFAMEMFMSHLADEMGINDLEFKKQYFADKGKASCSHTPLKFDVPLPRMVEMAEKATDYSNKRKKYASHKGGRLKTGIGISFGNLGFPLSGGVEWNVIKAKAKLRKHSDGNVEILASVVDIGQGIRTALCKMAAAKLGIPVDRVSMGYPDTDISANSGITAASRGVVCVGAVVSEAAEKLKEIWQDGIEQETEAEYRKPEHVEDFDIETLSGDNFCDYSWSAVVVEVTVDPLTGNIKITDLHGVFNTGTPIDENILRGQMEGGMLQGLGYGATERIVIGDNGKMFNTAFADYHIPTSTDVPNMSVEFETSVFPDHPFGAKGVGELPMLSVAPAYLRAVEQAVGKIRPVKLRSIPFVPENVLDVLSGRKING